MNPIIRDLLDRFPSLKQQIPINDAVISNVIAHICPHGVVIGGTYLHFKGKEYVVLDVIRDADDWDGERLVQYVEKTDATHRCTRKLSHFLGDLNELIDDRRGPRFKWIPK